MAEAGAVGVTAATGATAGWGADAEAEGVGIEGRDRPMAEVGADGAEAAGRDDALEDDPPQEEPPQDEWDGELE